MRTTAIVRTDRFTSLVSVFPVAPAPSPEKLRGGYYTPAPIARWLADWVSGGGPRILEPSCGDGSLLRQLGPGTRPLGVELFADEAAQARIAAPHADIIVNDFFNWFQEREVGQWDGAIGNPPFIRFQNWTEPTRSNAFDVMRRVGMRPSKLTNSWVPFVVASALALRPGGRLGFVIPAELLQVTYAAQLRAFLVDQFSELTAIAFKRLVFEGILQEVVLLLGIRGEGPARIRVLDVQDAGALPSPDALRAAPHVPALLHENEKWTKYFLDDRGITALRETRLSDALTRLGVLGSVDVGIVTGRNSFFVLRPSATDERGLHRHTVRLVSRSAHLNGVELRDADYVALEEDDALCHLLAVDPAVDPLSDPALGAYVREGEAADVHRGYKCSIRPKWWVVPSLWYPDAFLLRQIYDHPRIIANTARATATDTIHRVRLLNGTPARSLAAASINSATFAFAEVMGRSYGGGVLELEPREAEDLPFPDPSALTSDDVRRVDELSRAGNLTAALDYVDERLLIPALGAETVGVLREVWSSLRDRRLTRSKKA